MPKKYIKIKNLSVSLELANFVNSELLPGIINDLSGPGDMVVCLGAGSITQLANTLPEKLRMLRYGSEESDQ